MADTRRQSRNAGAKNAQRGPYPTYPPTAPPAPYGPYPYPPHPYIPYDPANPWRLSRTVISSDSVTLKDGEPYTLTTVERSSEE